MRHLSAIILCLLFLTLTGCQWNAHKLAVIEVTPENANMHPGQTQTFTALGRNGKGEIIPVEPAWVLSEEIGTLSATSGATVTFTASTTGSSFLKVVAEGITGKAFISVTELLLTRLALTPEHLQIGINQTFQFQLSGEDQFGNSMLPGQPTYELSGEIGTFDPQTLTFTATASGLGSLTLTVEDISITALITVQDPVELPDSALEEAIRATLEQDTGSLFPYQLATIQTLVAPQKEISILDGLQYCTGLETLVLSANQITDLTPLTGLNQLLSLSLDSNLITNLTPIGYLLNLEELDLAHNPIDDAYPLANLLHLKFLDLTNTNLPHLDMLNKMEDMRILNLAYNHSITEIEALGQMPFLESLQLSGTFVSDLTPLANKANLKELKISGTSIGSSIAQLEPLRSCRGLEILHADDSGLSGLSPLAELTALRELKVTENAITNVAPLSGLINLQKVWLSENQIADLSPLLDNAGLGAGDFLHLEGNLLDLSDGSPDRQNIVILEERGVTVYYQIEANTE